MKRLLFFLLTIILLSSCVQDIGAVKSQGQAVDYAKTTATTATGCGSTGYFILTSTTTYSCSASCPSGTHIATQAELDNFKTTSQATTLITSLIAASKGLCISDNQAIRPTNDVYISNDYCSCLNGKADILNNCDAYCASIPLSTAPIIHVNTTIGTNISTNTKLGNLYNWCNVQLAQDTTAPQCFLSAWDGVNTIDNIPVTLNRNTNSFTADITGLGFNTTYIAKIYEGKTGGNASSNEFQIRRVRAPSSTTTIQGALKIAPISQYTCLTYGGVTDSAGNIIRTNFSRNFYYYPANEAPAPIPPVGGTNQSQVVCHDESLYGPVDSVMYPRLELIPNAFTLWDKSDPRFATSAVNAAMPIVTILQDRLLNEYNNTTVLPGNLFNSLTSSMRPNVTAGSNATTTNPTTPNISNLQGYFLIARNDPTTGRTLCPYSTYFNGTDPLYRLLKDYMGDTEAFYQAEKEPETILTGTNQYTTVYGTMLVTETTLKYYGFYIENGMKIRATTTPLALPTPDTFHTKTIYYYWPVNTTMDPLEQGDRKLYTVKYADQINGSTSTSMSTSPDRTTDKRWGCIPKTTR